ncbi:MAG: alpha/beta hydrolase fold domain-containing protein, partial [Alphaproteobacteria bacterium]|nr:alpha/beta hydrolase fold domain-containing protein [Alphaproteobacteria bacterium]
MISLNDLRIASRSATVTARQNSSDPTSLMTSAYSRTGLQSNRERLLVNFHGGAYVFAPGRSCLEDAILMASRGFRVVTVDYRMAPDF